MSSLWVHFDPIVFFVAELVAMRCAATAAELRLRGGGARLERLGACYAPLTARRDASRPSQRYCVAAAFCGAAAVLVPPRPGATRLVIALCCCRVRWLLVTEEISQVELSRCLSVRLLLFPPSPPISMLICVCFRMSGGASDWNQLRKLGCRSRKPTLN